MTEHDPAHDHEHEPFDDHEPDRRRRRKVTTVFLALGAVIVLAAVVVAVVLIADAVVDDERRAAPTLPIAVPTDSVAAPATEVTVDSVVQGDEIVVDDGSGPVTIRIAGIDAPDVDTGQCWSKESRSFAERLLEGERVEVGNGGVAEGSTVSVRLADGTDFATASVADGMARALGNIDLTATEQQARADGVGLWGPFCEGQVFPPIDGPAQPSPSTFTRPSDLTFPPPAGSPPTTT